MVVFYLRCSTTKVNFPKLLPILTTEDGGGDGCNLLATFIRDKALEKCSHVDADLIRRDDDLWARAVRLCPPCSYKVNLNKLLGGRLLQDKIYN
ncbi:hypothetical protein SAY87_023978 [Trapa incisa]|uniref:Uncharacterized protein n=1 Tax=Trapa incisa TaxID=236973 RepID=A0AAN7L7R4_9MYRT|nr:hypothetical protein SAY87_023978 [Trapa incisa]